MTKVTGLQKPKTTVMAHMGLIDYPKCFEHYVTREYIGTGGCASESAALRCMLKQS